ncbi:MAG: histidine kinase, partial [Rhizobiaceae bacterium]|nr:histidine kinase [Rhizobiaceae bacterium]
MAKGTRPATLLPSAPRGRPAPRTINSTVFPIVAIGASAGGLGACAQFLDALPKETGMSFILVQHLDPTHDSLMVDLLATHTSMAVRQATEGMLVERDHLVVIPPGRFLSVKGGALHLASPPNHAGGPRGARMPFDVLLHSLAEDCGARTVCVVLSGTGTDGSMGLRSIHRQSGIVIAQDPEEAAYDGMPRSAIATGLVNHVLPVAKMADVIVHRQRRQVVPAPLNRSTKEDVGTRLGEIIALLASRTSYDFTPYKPGTLQRRIERRMAMADVGHDDAGRYLSVLQRDPSELELLAKDLLINVTSFFRDPKVFDFLAERLLPDLVRDHAPDRPIRLWVPACSSGEEAYSLAMIFEEAIGAAKRDVRLQVFASDLDPDAVACAREALYPETIRADVSQERLARFFVKEEHGYRVLPSLRSSVVVTVQDVLGDPPFSRIDLVSCRNLMIYLGAE